MGKKKKNNGKRGGNRFFRWIRSDLPDEEEKKSPVLLLGVNKISDSPSFVRRRSSEPTGSIRFFRPPKSKYTRGLHGDERLEKIRQDLLVHKQKEYIPSNKELSIEPEDNRCLKLNCVSNCVCNKSERGSFSFQRDRRQSSICTEVYDDKKDRKKEDYSENDIEFTYKEHVEDNQPGCSKNFYNVTPKSTDRKHFLLSNLNERFRKTLSLDSRKIETGRIPLSLPQTRPKSLVATSNIINKSSDLSNFEKASQPKKKRKSFFSLDTFFDKKSDCSSIDDYVSSKYKSFQLESDDSALFRPENKVKTPDLLNLPVIIDSVRKKQSDTKRQLEKLENHYYTKLKTRQVIDAVPKDATDGPSGHINHVYIDDDDVEYIEPIQSNFTSQSTLILDKNNKDSVLTIFTDETDIKLPSSTVSPKSDVRSGENDIDSIGAYEIEVKESDLLKVSKDLTVKVMDKSVDSIGSCSLDVDASTDFSDTTSGSLNLLTPSSTTSRIREFTSRIQERASTQPFPNSPQGTPVATSIRTPVNSRTDCVDYIRTSEDATPTPQRSEFKHSKDFKEYIKPDNLLKPPTKYSDNSSHRSRTKKREEREDIFNKKPSYLHLACSVNGYNKLTTYDSKLRRDLSKSREASPIRPITHSYYKTDSLLVPVPVSKDKVLVPTFEPHDTRPHLTAKAPAKAHTDPYLAPIHVFMAEENKQLKNDFLGPSMTTTSRPYISSESKNFASSMLHEKDQVDNAKDIAFKSSYSETNFRKTVANGSETQTITSQRFSSESYTISSNGKSKRVEITKENGEKLTSPMKSFIQQRVERLYGPGALAQGFLMQKKYKKSFSEEDANVLTEKSLNCSDLKPSPKKFNTSLASENLSSPNGFSESVSLPVLRHLRPEFRAQLPISSPKKSKSPEKLVVDIPIKTESENLCKNSNENVCKNLNLNENVCKNLNLNENVCKSNSSEDSISNGVSVIDLSREAVNGESVVKDGEVNNGGVVKDGHYFLELEKKETERLIALAITAEKELENLQNQEVSEEILGFLRSAAGKARLLATQKMQQFEGLCYNNLNARLDEPFPTTVEDLQGFWDMVCLQVRNVDALYHQIDQLKANNWQELSPTPAPAPTSAPAVRRARPTAAAQPNAKARAAAEKREADRKAMLEHRRRVARERMLASRAGGPDVVAATSRGQPPEGSQEVEIFVGKSLKTKVAQGDCRSTQSDDSQLS